MTAVEKKSIACFLDITSDFLSSGYKTKVNDCSFTDDVSSTASSEISLPQDRVSCNTDSIEQIADEIRLCKNCPLGMTRKNAAPGEGSLQPLVMVIGEGPGAEEDAQGRPFVGRAGQLLDKMLEAINLSRNSNCFIANVVKCRPPNNRDPYPEETAACAHFLERQITILKPRFILAAGRVAAQTLLKTTESIGKLRGKFTELTAGNITLPFIATYHPAALLRNEDLKRPAWEDLKLLRSMLDKDKTG
ncbi:MAG: uracil-DNA glycosylase [Treponema sp.]|jgi:DNA polymerase|nr:uracil-DNA glycosylase [Treponema sp.]